MKNSIKLTFPGKLEYIPAIRKFVSGVAMSNKFSNKFAFRLEIIVDEICNNAVQHGSLSAAAQVEVLVNIDLDAMNISVSDSGGKMKDIKRLKDVLALTNKEEIEGKFERGRGMDIVKTLSSDIHLNVLPNGRTEIKVIKFRENLQNPNGKVTN